jgi:DNA-binding NarL/FixJ family response regulator
MAIRVVVIEDDRETLREFQAALEEAQGYAFAGGHASAESAQAAFVPGSWDVALVDVQLPGINGLELIRRLKGMDPTLRCLVMTVVHDAGTIFEGLRLGADGYLLKRDDPKTLVVRLGEMLAGEVPLSPAVARQILQHFRATENDPRWETLSPAERRVLLALSGGASNKDLAATLGLGESTVRAHLTAAFRKLHLRSRAEAVAFLGRRGHGGGA